MNGSSDSLPELATDQPNVSVAFPDLLRYVRSALQKEEPQPQKFARMRISDAIFGTYAQILNHLQSLGFLDEIRIPADFNRDDDAEKVDDHFGLPSPLALALLSTAQVVLRWDTSEAQPVETGIAHADILQRDLQTTISQVGSDPTLEQLFAHNPIWGGLSPLSRISAEMITILEQPLGEHILQSTRRSAIEVSPSNTPEHIHLANIIRFIIDRLEELLGEQATKLREEMRNWRRWEPFLVVPQHTDAQALEAIYRNVMIPPDILLKLTDAEERNRKDAKKWITQHGGFLHEPAYHDFYFMIERGESRMLKKPNDTHEPPMGYYSVITDETDVGKLLTLMCGYEEGVTYTKEDLPQTSLSGWRLNWLKPSEAAIFLNSVDQVAITMELAVSLVDSAKDVFGRGTALKHAVHSAVRDSSGKKLVFTRYFEIVEINGQPVSGGMMNIPSRTFINETGTNLLATAEETFTRSDVGTVKVLWYYCVSDIQETIESIESKKPSQE